MFIQRNIAISLMNKEQYSEALPILLDLLEEAPDDYSLYYLVGQCYRFGGHASKAIDYLKKAASLNPDDAEIFLALGSVLMLEENYDEALEVQKKAVRLDPSMQSAYESMGQIYRKLGNYQKAFDCYVKMEETLLESAKTRAGEHRGERKAVSIYDVLKSDPAYAIVKNNLGICSLELKEYKRAKEQFEESIRFIPENYDFPDPYRHLEEIGTRKLSAGFF